MLTVISPIAFHTVNLELHEKTFRQWWILGAASEPRGPFLQ